MCIKNRNQLAKNKGGRSLPCFYFYNQETVVCPLLFYNQETVVCPLLFYVSCTLDWRYIGRNSACRRWCGIYRAGRYGTGYNVTGRHTTLQYTCRNGRTCRAGSCHCGSIIYARCSQGTSGKVDGTSGRKSSSNTLNACLLRISRQINKLRQCRRRQDTQNHDHHDQFNQGKTRLLFHYLFS